MCKQGVLGCPQTYSLVYLFSRFVGKFEKLMFPTSLGLLAYSDTVQGTYLPGMSVDPFVLLPVCRQCQGSLLLLVGPLLGMPFMSTSMVAAHTYVSAR